MYRTFSLSNTLAKLCDERQVKSHQTHRTRKRPICRLSDVHNVELKSRDEARLAEATRNGKCGAPCNRGNRRQKQSRSRYRRDLIAKDGHHRRPVLDC